MAIVITGASRGIGKSIATTLSREGYNVAINYLGAKREALQVRDECRAFGVEAEIYEADVSDYKACDDLIKTVYSDFGSLYGLVNNAGIIRDALLLKMSEEDFDQVIKVNLKGIFNCCQAAAKIMIPQERGNIVNISSVSGLRGNVGQVNYVAAKSGVIGITKSLGLELIRYNIRVNAVAPGFIKTDMTDHIPQKIMADIKKRIPIRRMGTPQDVANAVKFLISDDSAYITGQVLSVDGGINI